MKLSELREHIDELIKKSKKVIVNKTSGIKALMHITQNIEKDLYAILNSDGISSDLSENRILSKLATDMQRDLGTQDQDVLDMHGDSSTKLTKQSVLEAELSNKSNESTNKDLNLGTYQEIKSSLQKLKEIISKT